MPILTGDILQYLSAAVGSTGGVRSATAMTSGVVNNLWADITDNERLAGGERFRKTFFKNNNATDELILPIMYLPTAPIAGTVSLGLGFDIAEDDDEVQGNMSALSTPAIIAAIADDASDTRVLTVWGLNSAGDAVSDSITLNGLTEAVSAITFSKVWAVEAEATHVVSDVEIRQGAAGPVVGSIPASKACCWLWVVSPVVKASGIALPDLEAGNSYGLWRRLSWTAGVDPVRPDSMTTAIEEA